MFLNYKSLWIKASAKWIDVKYKCLFLTQKTLRIAALATLLSMNLFEL